MHIFLRWGSRGWAWKGTASEAGSFCVLLHLQWHGTRDACAQCCCFLQQKTTAEAEDGTGWFLHLKMAHGAVALASSICWVYRWEIRNIQIYSVFLGKQHAPIIVKSNICERWQRVLWYESCKQQEIAYWHISLYGPFYFSMASYRAATPPNQNVTFQDLPFTKSCPSCSVPCPLCCLARLMLSYLPNLPQHQVPGETLWPEPHTSCSGLRETSAFTHAGKWAVL